MAFTLVQAVMRLKNDEAEEALEQFEKIEDMREENDRLNTALNKLKGKHGDQEANIEELLETERDLQELTKEFQAQTKEIEKVRADRDFLENKVEDLEKEKKKLKREMQSMENELRESKRADDSPSKADDEDEVDPRRVKDLEDNMRLKNKQIHQLLEDIEHLEKDNEAYQEKIGGLRDDLAEATRQINLITGEFVLMKNSMADTKTLIDTLQGDNTKLKLKLEDHLKDKARRDKQIEEISIQVDGKVEEMKNICSYKDAQIEELRSRLNRAVVSSGGTADTEASKQNVAVLTKAIKERDEQIEKLQDKLKDASR